LISYKPLIITLAERGLNLSDLGKLANIHQNTLSKFNKDENVGADILDRICMALKCGISNVVEIIDNRYFSNRTIAFIGEFERAAVQDLNELVFNGGGIPVLSITCLTQYIVYGEIDEDSMQIQNARKYDKAIWIPEADFWKINNNELGVPEPQITLNEDSLALFRLKFKFGVDNSQAGPTFSFSKFKELQEKGELEGFMRKVLGEKEYKEFIGRLKQVWQNREG
jgi:DNA-binding Xre family transcriptional regulator